MSLRGTPQLLEQLLRLTDGEPEDSSVSPAHENSGDLSHGTALLGAAPSKSGSALSLAPSSMSACRTLRRSDELGSASRQIAHAIYLRCALGGRHHAPARKQVRLG